MSGRQSRFKRNPFPTRHSQRQFEVFELTPGFKSDLQKRISANPLQAAADARESYIEAVDGYYERQRKMLQEAYGIAHALQRDHEAWEIFKRSEILQSRAQKPKHKDYLKWVLIYITTASETRDRDRANKCARALRQYQKDGVPTHEVAERIEKDGGIERLIQKAAEAKKAEDGESQNKVTSDPDDFYNISPTDELAKSTWSPDSNALDLECEKKYLKEAMKVRKKGETLTIKVEYIGKARQEADYPEGWRRFRVIAITRSHRVRKSPKN